MDIKALIARVKNSRLLSPEDRSYWLSKMESMRESDLQELDLILTDAEKLDWDSAVKEYDTAAKSLEQSVTKAEDAFAKIS